MECVTHWLAAPGQGPGTRVPGKVARRPGVLPPQVRAAGDCRQAPGPHFSCPPAPCAFHQLWWQWQQRLTQRERSPAGHRAPPPAFRRHAAQFSVTASRNLNTFLTDCYWPGPSPWAPSQWHAHLLPCSGLVCVPASWCVAGGHRRAGAGLGLASGLVSGLIVLQLSTPGARGPRQMPTGQACFLAMVPRRQSSRSDQAPSDRWTRAYSQPISTSRVHLSDRSWAFPNGFGNDPERWEHVRLTSSGHELSGVLPRATGTARGF